MIVMISDWKSTIARVHCHKCIFSIDNWEFQTTLCTCAVLNQLNLPRQSSIHFYSTNGLLRHSIVLVFFIRESWVLLKKSSIRRSQRNRNLDLNFFFVIEKLQKFFLSSWQQKYWNQVIYLNQMSSYSCA